MYPFSFISRKALVVLGSRFNTTPMHPPTPLITVISTSSCRIHCEYQVQRSIDHRSLVHPARTTLNATLHIISCAYRILVISYRVFALFLGPTVLLPHRGRPPMWLFMGRWDNWKSIYIGVCSVDDAVRRLYPLKTEEIRRTYRRSIV